MTETLKNVLRKSNGRHSGASASGLGGSFGALMNAVQTRAL
jgi:hypothetical protein